MCNDTTAEASTAIQAEADDYDGYDSGFGEVASSTTSISSSIMRYREENGRTYHAYKEGIYAFPNDSPEADRLDLQHHLCSLTFDGKLFTAPIPKDKKLNHVLDVGTGTGIWAIDFADDHPEANVLGIDLSPSELLLKSVSHAIANGQYKSSQLSYLQMSHSKSMMPKNHGPIPTNSISYIAA